MIKPPKNLKAPAGHAVPIHVKPDRENDGEYDRQTRSITVDAKLQPIGQKEALLHEALHMLLHLSGVGAVLYPEHEREEVFVRLMTPVLLDFMRANKKAMQWLIE